MVPHRKPHETTKESGKSMATSRIPQNIEADKSIKSEAIQEKIRIRSATAWRPTQGDMIDGTIVKILVRSGGDYGAYPVVILDTGSATYTAIHAFHTLLRNQLAAIKASSGDEITIVYQGKVESKNKDLENKPRKYHNYILVSDGVESDLEYTWDSEDDDAPKF
jgi:hypothetical protein